MDLGSFKLHMNARRAPRDVVVAMRPEDIGILSAPAPEAVEFMAYSVLPSGADSTVIARHLDQEVTIRVSGISKISMDEKIWLKFDCAMINLYDKETGELVGG